MGALRIFSSMPWPWYTAKRSWVPPISATSPILSDMPVDIDGCLALVQDVADGKFCRGLFCRLFVDLPLLRARDGQNQLLRIEQGGQRHADAFVGGRGRDRKMDELGKGVYIRESSGGGQFLNK